MTFRATAPDLNFPFGKLVSETGRWEMGFQIVLFGVCVSAALAGSAFKAIDYCGGSDPFFRVQLFDAVLRILSGLPETITERELQDLMPKWKRRPISNDPECWGRLQELAAQSRPECGEAQAA